MNDMDTCEASTLSIHRPNIETDLKQKQERLEKQLSEINELQGLLAENPKFSRFANLLFATRHI